MSNADYVGCEKKWEETKERIDNYYEQWHNEFEKYPELQDYEDEYDEDELEELKEYQSLLINQSSQSVKTYKQCEVKYLNSYSASDKPINDNSQLVKLIYKNGKEGFSYFTPKQTKKLRWELMDENTDMTDKTIIIDDINKPIILNSSAMPLVAEQSYPELREEISCQCSNQISSFYDDLYGKTIKEQKEIIQQQQQTLNDIVNILSNNSVLSIFVTNENFKIRNA